MHDPRGDRPHRLRDGNRTNRRPPHHRIGVGLGLSLLASLAVLTAAPPASAATATVTPTPDPPAPMAPLALAVTGSGCAAGAPVTVELRYHNVREIDMVFVLVIDSADVVSDGNGDWAATVDAPVLYPGRWSVHPGCGAPAHDLSVAPPASMQATLTPASVTEGVATHFTLQGRGCAGAEVWFSSGQRPTAEPGVVGRVPVAADGTWSTTFTTAPLAGFSGITAACVLPGEVFVYYPHAAASVVTTTTPAPSTTAPGTTAPSTRVQPVPLTPRFTG